MMQPFEAWIIVGPDGDWYAGTLSDTLADAWACVVPWDDVDQRPSEGDIEILEKGGTRAVRVRVVPVEGGDA